MNKVNKNKTKNFYTTGDIARYCEVDLNTVKRWIRQDNLRAFSTPSGHYRIARDEFISFIKKQGFTYDPAYFGEDDHLTDFLIIEDNQKHVELLSYLLKNLYDDVRIEIAPDGFEGYMKISQQRPKLVLLDLRLPRLTGLELLRVLRSRDEIKDTKVLVISAYLDDPTIEELEKLKIDGMIFKPVKRNDLKEKCDVLFNSARVQREGLVA